MVNFKVVRENCILVICFITILAICLYALFTKSSANENTVKVEIEKVKVEETEADSTSINTVSSNLESGLLVEAISNIRAISTVILESTEETLSSTQDSENKTDEIKVKEDNGEYKAEECYAENIVEEETSSALDEQYSYGGYSASDYEVVLLAKLISREAGNEPYLGQIAVGATVMNRINSDAFDGNTIAEVIKTPGQYDNGIPVESYSYNEENYQAALEAIAGNDPTKGAVYYYNPRISNDTWIPSHIQSCIIGNHNFYFIWYK